MSATILEGDVYTSDAGHTMLMVSNRADSSRLCVCAEGTSVVWRDRPMRSGNSVTWLTPSKVLALPRWADLTWTKVPQTIATDESITYLRWSVDLGAKTMSTAPPRVVSL